MRVLEDVILLYTLNDGGKAGYDIRKMFTKLFGVKVSFSSLYAHLDALKSSGFISEEWVSHPKVKDMGKIEYSLTETGWTNLRATVEALSIISGMLQLSPRQTD